MIGIDLKPLQGLKQSEKGAAAHMVAIGIDLKPLQGLKLVDNSVYVCTFLIGIDLKPLQGLKRSLGSSRSAESGDRNRPQTLTGIETSNKDGSVVLPT